MITDELPSSPSLLQALEVLNCELVQYRQLEEELQHQISVRSAALKQEEALIRKELDGVLIRHEMLQCEHSSLDAILRGDRVWVIRYQSWYMSAVLTSKSAAMERMGQNAWITQEITRLQAEIHCLEADRAQQQHSDSTRCDVAIDSPSLLLQRAQLVREAKDRFAAHSERVLGSLEINAQAGRERHGRVLQQMNEAVLVLRGEIVAMRNFLREMYPPDVANELITWAEAGGRIARSKARWDFQHLLCPLDLVILEGLRLQLADLI